MNSPSLSNRKFAREGRSRVELREEMNRLRADDLSWKDPKNLKASYDAGDDVAEVAWEAYTQFRGDNLLYGNVLYPSLPKMAGEVVDKALELLNAPSGASGSITTGGTESIILAVKCARERARELAPTSGVPEIVVAQTCHAAFNKAADMLGLRIIRVATGVDYLADVEAMAGAVTDNTIMIVGSATSYPMGCLDPIERLAGLAREHGLWLHVDACLGGFFLPFARDLGEPVPAFDFSLDEVMSISVDLHKYGYTSRGASLLLLRDGDLSRFQEFEFSDWPTGRFTTLTIAGSRPGGAVASAWAVMNYLGYDGYLERVVGILEVKRRLLAEVERIDGVRVLGRPLGGIVGIGGAGDLDMAAVRDGMAGRGWQFGPLFDPAGMNLLLNFRHGSIVDRFAGDLEDMVEQARAGKLTPADERAGYGN